MKNIFGESIYFITLYYKIKLHAKTRQAQDDT